MTDLVERLRKYGSASNDGYARGPMLEAADLIEQLKAEIARKDAALRGIVTFGKRHPGSGHSCALLALDALEATNEPA